jgi:hypothetical protein
MLLIASLSRNDPALVAAAIEAGADAVFAHLHLGEPKAAPKPDGEAPQDQATGEPAAEARAAEMAPTPAEPADAPTEAPSDGDATPTDSTEDSPDHDDSSIAEAAGPAAESPDTYFGGIDEEREHLIEMVRAAEGRPLGVVVGVNGDLTVAELEEMVKIGVDFIAVYPHRAPAALLTMEALGHIARLDPGYPSGSTRGLAEIEVDAFAVSAGRPRDSLPGFTVHDMASFRQFLDTLNRPVMVASSWEVRPDDLRFFREQGVEALILTPHVLGESAESVGERVSEFGKAIAALGPPLGRGRSQEGRRVILPRVQPVLEQADEDDDDDDE